MADITLNVSELQIRPGTILVVRSETVLDGEISGRIQKEIRDRLPVELADTPVLVCDPGVNLVTVHMDNLCKTVFCPKMQKGVGNEGD